jgi:hypothetical protein
MNVAELKQYAINEVKYGVKLHKEHVSTVLYFIDTRDIYQLRLCEQNAFYLPEKNYFYVICNELENIIKQENESSFGSLH